MERIEGLDFEYWEQISIRKRNKKHDKKCSVEVLHDKVSCLPFQSYHFSDQEIYEGKKEIYFFSFSIPVKKPVILGGQYERPRQIK